MRSVAITMPPAITPGGQKARMVGLLHRAGKEIDTRRFFRGLP